jgi:hypothetical protein
MPRRRTRQRETAGDEGIEESLLCGITPNTPWAPKPVKIGARERERVSRVGFTSRRRPAAGGEWRGGEEKLRRRRVDDVKAVCPTPGNANRSNRKRRDSPRWGRCVNWTVE